MARQIVNLDKLAEAQAAAGIKVAPADPEDGTPRRRMAA
jgi:hypothetical protein